MLWSAGQTIQPPTIIAGPAENERSIFYTFLTTTATRLNFNGIYASTVLFMDTCIVTITMV
jgi:hypothetical protein